MIEHALKKAAALGCVLYKVDWCEVAIWHDDEHNDWCVGLSMLEDAEGDGLRRLCADCANGPDVATALASLITFLQGWLNAEQAEASP